jgi:serine/threonine-protein kinase
MPLMLVAAVGILAYGATLIAYSTRLQREQRLAAAAQQFMADLFRSPDPYAPADPGRGVNIRVVDALEIGQRRIRTELQDQPELRASLLASISDVYASLDQHREAISLREEAVTLETQLYGPRSATVAESLRELGNRYAIYGDMERADALLERQLEISRSIFPARSPQLAVARIASGLHAGRRGNVEQSRALLLEGVERLRTDASAHARSLVDALIALEQQRSFVVEPLDFDPLREAERVALDAFGADSLQAALVQVRLASSMTNRGDYAGSERNFLAAIPVLEARLGENHGSTLAALNNLGYLYHRRGDLAGAEQTHRELLKRNIAKHGAVHRAVGDSYQNLGGALTHQGRYAESVPLHRKAYEIFRSVLNEDNYVIAVPLLSIAFAELQRDDLVAAEAAAREALQRLEPLAGALHLQGVASCLVGLSLERQGLGAEGEALVAASHSLIGTTSLPDPYPELCRLPTRDG